MEAIDLHAQPALEISLVPYYNIEAIWSQVAPMLKRATDISEGRYRLRDLKEKLKSGEFHLWAIYEPDLRIVAAITSTFTKYPQAKALHGQFLGGDRLEDWQDQFCYLFDRWGRDNQCSFVEFTGRPGWKRLLERNGYREVFRTYQRDLT